VTADRRLVRAYRRLTRFYPPGPRRDELLDTLIECAPAGRRHPTSSDIVNLVWHGSLARLGRPRSKGIVMLALLIALAAGFVGGQHGQPAGHRGRRVAAGGSGGGRDTRPSSPA
jgi:hypothetical protein